MRLRQAKRIVERLFCNKTWRKIERSRTELTSFMHKLYTGEQILEACYIILYKKERMPLTELKAKALIDVEKGIIK